ncbi:MAG: GIY-YIG nuclease family protein [Opitutales bacterium]|nr:GIY-YIG nuclease family protein [Opitutales bacterium]
MESLTLRHSKLSAAKAGRTTLEFRAQLRMAGHFYYVYILESERKPGATYVGFTEDLRARLAAHNAGNCIATRPLRPWRILSYHAVRGKETARALEKYLKSASGKAFANKRFR